MNMRLQSAADGGEGATAPQTFTRNISAPAGLPWEQRRAAELEARMGAPGSMGALQWRLARLEAWRPGQPGLFAAVYLRASGPGLDHRAEVRAPDGRLLQVRFRSPEAEGKALVAALVRVAVVIAPVLLSVVAVAASLIVKADRETRIEALEARAARAAIVADRARASAADARALRSAGADGHTVLNALSDLDWLAEAKTPGAHIQRVHWENGMMAITVRGETPPAHADGRELRRASSPLGPALWLWGVGPASGTTRP
jgi:hypothetical protein